MSARTYMPYIDGAMIHIQRIYSWNAKVDEMRWITKREYDFNNGLKLFYEEKNEYTKAKIANDTEEMIDALVDQFVVAIGEIRKCALADDYENIDFWEDKANDAYGFIFIELTEVYQKEEPVSYDYIEELQDKCITEVIDALFTRFWYDAYIDENGKFIKSKSYRKPDLSFLK